jgi:2-phosphosulfolactate phosphatase
MSDHHKDAVDLPALPVKLFTSPREVTDDDLRGCSVVVIDVLRSSSTIVAGLAAGAREVIPVLSPAEGGKLAGRAERGISLLCGEREGKKIDGFDLGNSPLEYTPQKVNGRILIFATTNGAPAILRARVADRVYVGGFNNFGAITKRLVEDKNPVVIVCAGKLEQFAIEDFVCGGKFVNALESRAKRKLELSDGARAASLLHRRFDGSITSLLKSSSHGRYLVSIGCEEDIEYCARIDTHPIVPMFVEGKIRGYQPDGSPIGESALSQN